MDLPSCFGQYWEGVAGSDCTVGDSCKELDTCLARFASVTLVKYQRKLGKEATPEKLSLLTSVRPEAILLALNFQKNAGISLDSEVPQLPPSNNTDDATEQDAEIIPPPPEESTLEDIPDPPDATDGVDDAMAKKKELEERIKKSAADNALAEDAVPVPVKKRGRKKKVVESTAKSKSGKKARGKAVNPPVAEPAKRAKGSAERKTKRSASDAWAQASIQKHQETPPGQPMRRWDPVHNKTRWERERERNPLIAALPVGLTVPRLWRGETTVTLVRQGYYLYNGVRYPTLNSVMVAIMGLRPYPKQLKKDGTRPEGVRYMTPWSATRWFGLHQLAKKLGLEIPIERKRPPKKKKRSRKS